LYFAAHYLYTTFFVSQEILLKIPPLPLSLTSGTVKGNSMKLQSKQPSKSPKKRKIPLFSSPVPAGFPSPADDYLEKKLDLNELLVPRPASTFFIRVTGDSMVGAGIHDGDILIIDRSLVAKNKSIVLAILNGEFTVKRFINKTEKIFLYAENPKYKPIEILESMDFEVWGVVAHVIHTPK
jgi:DNA polymerase V